MGVCWPGGSPTDGREIWAAGWPRVTTGSPSMRGAGAQFRTQVRWGQDSVGGHPCVCTASQAHRKLWMTSPYQQEVACGPGVCPLCSAPWVPLRAHLPPRVFTATYDVRTPLWFCVRPQPPQAVRTDTPGQVAPQLWPPDGQLCGDPGFPRTRDFQSPWQQRPATHTCG